MWAFGRNRWDEHDYCVPRPGLPPFTPPGGRITIDATRGDRVVELHVRDNGVGIDPEFLPHVFDRFRQGDSSSTRTYGGLGLAIAKQFVEAHDGTIAVASEGRSQGAVFSVRLPLAGRPDDRIRPPEPASPATHADAPRLDGISVLVVDDEPDAREVMAQALRSHGARVTVAESARAGFDVLASTAIDVLLADIAMPDEDGCSLIRRVRASSDVRVATVPAAAVTAHVRYAEREAAVAAGFQLHLAKPVEPRDLARAVERLAHRSAGSIPSSSY